MTHRYTRLITAEQLAQLQAEGAPLMVFDCSFNLFEPEEADRLFAQSHIAGSQQAHLERNLSAQPGQSAASGGRHPLPTREAFASWLGRCGFANDMQAMRAYQGKQMWALFGEYDMPYDLDRDPSKIPSLAESCQKAATLLCGYGFELEMNR